MKCQFNTLKLNSTVELLSEISEINRFTIYYNLVFCLFIKSSKL